MEPNKEALHYFVGLLNEGKYQYKNGEIWRHWEPRRGWLEEPRRAEKESSNGYYMLRTFTKEIGKPLYVMAHRVVWSFFYGDIPDKLEINHMNGNKKDNRISNLELVTSEENKKHAKENGLLKPCTGLDNGRAKLSDSEVSTIKELIGTGKFMQKEIANFYGVRPNQISRITTGSRRTNVKRGGNDMDFNLYQEKSKRTLNKNLDYKMALANYSMGLAGEAAGEVCDYLKKVIFHGHDLDRLKVADELGDVLFYIAAICSTVGIDMNDIALGNVEKLIKRYPEGFSEERSINRVE